FALLPAVTDRDAFWTQKQQKHKTEAIGYTAIHVPKNSAVAIIIAALAFLLGFGMIWHIFWMSGLSLVAIIATIIWRANQDDTERTISARSVEKIESQRQGVTA